MKKVERTEILDYVTYGEARDALRAEAMAAKDRRRIVLAGGTLTFLFENRTTIRYQVHEMLRAERIVREADVQHELDTYNELLGGHGELGCTLLIGIADEVERADKLSRWLELPSKLWMERADGSRVPATFDPRQVGEARLSSVQYLKFAVGGEAPVAIGCDLADLAGRTELTADQRAALDDDLADA
jgi:hypothetical protein